MPADIGLALFLPRKSAMWHVLDMSPLETRNPIAPLLLTHLDPDLYPQRSLPLNHELVIHILAHGAVWLKEVDLFLTERIRHYLSDSSNLRVFKGLVSTGRIKILVPDKTVPLKLDPHDHPLLATAMARDGKVPLKSEPWVLTDETRHFCATLDSILGDAGRGVQRADTICCPRQTPPSGENQFATKLHAVLSQSSKRWLKRTPFKGITEAMIHRFAEYSENPDRALADLVDAGVRPNATNGFYRSLAYQCADLFRAEGETAVQAMKNLAQSVYAYCELKREKAAGTYGGKRLAEMPPDKPTMEQVRSGVIRVEVVPQDIEIPLTEDIGAVISSVLEKCDMSSFWTLVSRSSAPEQDFRNAWDHVAVSFVEEFAQPGRRLTQDANVQAAQLILAGATLAVDGAMAAFSWMPKIAAAVGAGIGAIATFGPPTVDLIRSAQLDLQKQELCKRVSAAAAIRCSKIV